MKKDLLELREKVLNSSLPEILDLMPKDTIYNYLVSSCQDFMNATAIDYLGVKITYEDFFKKIDAAASGLINLGVKPGEYVCLSPLATPEGIALFYAINKIGAVAHFINPAMSKTEIAKSIKSTNSKVFITMDLFYSPEMRKTFEESGIQRIIYTSLTDSLPIGLNTDIIKFYLITALKVSKSEVKKDDKCLSYAKLEKLGTKFPENYLHPYIPNQDAAIAYTSGSTGKSKAVVATNEAFNAMPLQMSLTEPTIEVGDGILTTMPLWIYYSLSNSIHEPLCLGTTLCLDPLFEAKKLDKRFAQYKINHWNTIPYYIKESFEKSPGIGRVDFSGIKTITTGGDFLLDSVKKHADAIIKNGGGTAQLGQGIGTSENLGCFAFQTGDAFNVGSSGRPLVGNHFKIINVQTGQVCGPNESGELYYFTPTLMKEYYGDEKLTDEALIPDENGIIWYKSGDLAHFDEDGQLYMDGRIRRIVMTLDETGFPTKIIPEKLKLEVSNHFAIDRAEVITVDDPVSITTSVLFVALKPDYTVDEGLKSDILDFCKQHVPSYMVPKTVIYLDSTPLKNMKVDYEELERIYETNLTNNKVQSRVRKKLFK